MPPLIIAIDANNLNHVYSRQRMTSFNSEPSSSSSSMTPTIPPLVEVSTNRCSSRTNKQQKTNGEQNKKTLKKQKKLPVVVHMPPVPLARVDSSFYSMDGLGTSVSLVRDQFQLEPRYQKFLAQVQSRKNKHKKLQRQLFDLKRRLQNTATKKRVRFATPLVTELYTRPYTDIDDIPNLFFQEEELDQFEQDREDTSADIVECAFVEEVYAISVAYQRRTSVDE